jgi:hypothetical protein
MSYPHEFTSQHGTKLCAHMPLRSSTATDLQIGGALAKAKN